MSRHSAGLLIYRRGRGGLELFLVHPGGPYWTNRDEHAWSIPKGEFDPDHEDAYETAVREFSEETGLELPDGDPRPLGEVRQAGGKRVTAWALEGDPDPAAVVGNEFEMEWPPGSGQTQSFPEVDRAQWVTVQEARRKLHTGQVALVDRLVNLLGGAA